MNAKPLFVLLFFFFLITIFAGGTIGDTDLTPDTPPVSSGSNSPGAFAPVVQGVQGGICGSPYSVRSGDTLSEIARACAINLSDLLAANPQITDPDLIHVGQQINLPVNSVQPALPVVEVQDQEPPQAAATAVKEEPAAQQAAEAEVQPATEQLAAQAPIPTEDAILSAFETARATGDETEKPPAVSTPQPAKDDQKIVAGSVIEVVVQGLPANAPVMVGIGQVGSQPFYFDERITNDQGVLNVAVGVPSGALPDQKWTVTVTSMSDPAVSVTAEPFSIDR